MSATIVASKGTTHNYMNTQITVTFYSVYYNDRLIIRTSDRSLALAYQQQYYKAPL